MVNADTLSLMGAIVFFAHQVIEKPSFAKLKMHFWNRLPKKEVVLNSDGISFLNDLS